MTDFIHMAFYTPQVSFEQHLEQLSASAFGEGLKRFKGEPVLHAWGQRLLLREGLLSAEARSRDVPVFEFVLPADPVIWCDVASESKAFLGYTRQLVKHFMRLAELMNADYGAINWEYSLECPADLTRRSQGFSSAFVNRCLASPEVWDGLHVKELKNGCYVTEVSHFALRPKVGVSLPESSERVLDVLLHHYRN